MIFKQKLLGIACLLATVVALGLLFFLKEPEETAPRTDKATPAQEIERKASTNKTSFGLERQPLDKIDIEQAESIEELERKALGHSEPEERIGAILEISQREDGRKTLGTLVSILHNDREGDVREAALDALEELEAISFDVVAKVALNDPEPSLRLRAVELLGEMDKRDKRIIEVLKHIASKDKDKGVRETAKDLLEEMGN